MEGGSDCLGLAGSLCKADKAGNKDSCKSVTIFLQHALLLTHLQAFCDPLCLREVWTCNIIGDGIFADASKSPYQEVD